MSQPETKTPHTIVRASAGSGKTYRLTSEFIARLFLGEDPSGMLATTFTRAAAGEILHRVLGRLSAGVLENAALAELQVATSDPALTHERCAQVLSALINQLHRLSIMTIDSFFSRLASSFSLELGLPMQYRLLEEDENESLQEQSVDQAIQECSRSEMVELLRSMQGQRIQMQTHSAIMKAVKAGYAMYLATDGNPEPWNTIDPVGRKTSDGQLLAALDQLETASIPLTKAGKPNSNWAKARIKSIELIRSKSWMELLKGGLGGTVLQGLRTNETPTYYKIDITPDLHELLIPVVEHARHELSTEHINGTLATFKLMHRFDDAYRTTKMSSGQLSFDDPPRLLNESRVTGDLEHLYFRLDGRIRHVMLDEFQDTSMPQFNLLSPILEELFSQDEEGRSVFVVGDIKQSLYTWRQAEPKLLGAMKEQWETLGEDFLTKSWRSSPLVLNAVDEVFGDLPNNDAMNSKEVGQSAAAYWHDQYKSHEAAKPELPGYVSLTVADGDEESSKEATEEVLWSCANRVAEARAQSPNATIAILVRQSKHIYPLLAKLSTLGVDACEDRGNPLVDAPSVAAAVSMLELIDHPSNSAALYHVRSTPLGQIVGLSDPKRVNSVASDLRERITTQGCVPLLTEWLKACASSMDQRGFTRFEQLIELAGRLEDDGRPGAKVLAMVAQSRKIDEPGHAPVRVITIHRSKGLEFDVVMLPLLGKAWSIRPDSILSRRDRPLGPISQVTRYPNKVMQSVHPELQSLHDQSMLEQINEELCCLYVAMTRAKSSLQMIVPADKQGRKGEPMDKATLGPAHLIRAALAPDEPASPGATLYETSSEQCWTSGIESESMTTTTTSHPKPVALNIRSPKTLRAGQLMSSAPSAEHESNLHSVSSLLEHSDHGQFARDHGQCVHSAFEQFDWTDDSKPDDTAIAQTLSDLGHPEDTISASIKELNAALKCPEVDRVLNLAHWNADHPSASKASVHHERPFVLRMGKSDQERLVQGRFDRLVIGRDGARVTNVQIVDYKTDRGAKRLGQSQLTEFASKHHPQMNAYRQAVASMYNLDNDAIEVVLIFTAAPGVVRL